MSLYTHNCQLKFHKNIVNSQYIDTLNLKLLFVLKRHTKTLNDTCIEAGDSNISNDIALYLNFTFVCKSFLLSPQDKLCRSNMKIIYHFTHQIHYIQYHQGTNITTMSLVPILQRKSLFHTVNKILITRVYPTLILIRYFSSHVVCTAWTLQTNFQDKYRSFLACSVCLGSGLVNFVTFSDFLSSYTFYLTPLR